MQIQTVTGTATPFTAIKSFQLPAPPGGITPSIQSGATMTFDGQNFSLQGDPPRPLPQFLGAIKAGWVVPTTEYTGREATGPVSAGIAVRSAEGGNPMDVQRKQVVTTAQAEEQEVGNIASHAAQVQQNNQANYRRQGYDGTGKTAQGRQVIAAEDQEGIPVRHLGNPDGRKNPVDMSTSASEAIRAAESVKVQPGQGKSREELMAQMTPEQRAAYENELQVRKAMHGQLDTQVAVPQTQVVAQVAPTETKTQEGITAPVTTGGGVETFDAGGTGGEGEVTTVVVDGIKMTNTNGPKKDQTVTQVTPKVDLANEDPRRVIAKAVCADFPDNYDFDASIRKKIARLQADYDDRPDVIRAVAAAETDADVKKRLIEEYPSVFGG
jgi:hypothetical protein